MRTIKIAWQNCGNFKDLNFYKLILKNDKNKLWRGLKCVFVSLNSISERRKDQGYFVIKGNSLCFTVRHNHYMHVKIFFCSFYCFCFILTALLRFKNGTVRKSRNILILTCARLWTNIFMSILCFSSVALSYKLFIWKLLKLSLLSLRSLMTMLCLIAKQFRSCMIKIPHKNYKQNNEPSELVSQLIF